MASARVTYRRRKSYNTKSNKIRKHRTPGGRLTIKYLRKNAKGVQTGVNTRSKLSGLKSLRNPQYKKLTHTDRSISRAYGGVLTPRELKDRIKRAFLIEEVKIVKKIVDESKQ